MPRDDRDDSILQPLLDRLAAGDEAAIDDLIEHSVNRLNQLAHFMFQDFPHVRRWYETSDVAQAAAVRLTRALKAVRPAIPRDFLNLAATQIRRELLDLARHEFGPEGAGAHHVSEPKSPGQNQSGDSLNKEHGYEGAGPATQARWRDLLEYIQDTLPPEEREVFDLLFVQSLTQEEAAKTLGGIPVIRVKRLWRSARLRLHKPGLFNLA